MRAVCSVVTEGISTSSDMVLVVVDSSRSGLMKSLSSGTPEEEELNQLATVDPMEVTRLE